MSGRAVYRWARSHRRAPVSARPAPQSDPVDEEPRRFDVRTDPREDERDRNPRAPAEAKPRSPLRPRSRWRRRCCIRRQARDACDDRQLGTCCAGGERAGRSRCRTRAGRPRAPQARHARRRRVQAAQAGAVLGDGRARRPAGVGVHVRPRRHRATRRGRRPARYRERGLRQLRLVPWRRRWRRRRVRVHGWRGPLDLPPHRRPAPLRRTTARPSTTSPASTSTATPTATVAHTSPARRASCRRGVDRGA